MLGNIMASRVSLKDVEHDLLSGLPVLIYDGDSREGETDMVFYAGRADWRTINTLRREAGGLICFATGKEEGDKLGLKYMTEVVKTINPNLVKLPKYGDPPAFSIYVNHVSTKTGITDYDRATTVRELYEVVKLLKEEEERAKEKFTNEFYSPGHVPVLLARNLNERKGHTELSVRLVEALGLTKAVVFAEMLADGRAMTKEEAMSYAKANGLLFLTGKEILEALGG